MNNETEPKKRKVVATSIEAYRSLDVATLNDRYKLIIDALGKLGEATTEETAAFCKKPHETLWKRFSELSNMGLIFRPGTKRVMKSGRMGFTWALTSNATVKTTSTEKALKPDGKDIASISRKIKGISDNIQQELFPAYQKVLMDASVS
jgi:hypothetical protein